MHRIRTILLLLALLLPVAAAASGHGAPSEPGELDMKSYIFGHVGDAYEWHITTVNGHPVSIPLPCIVFGVLYFILPLKTACILAIALGSPAPVTAVLWAKQYGKDTKLAVDCLIPSTILYFAVMGTILAILLKFGVIGA